VIGQAVPQAPVEDDDVVGLARFFPLPARWPSARMKLTQYLSARSNRLETRSEPRADGGSRSEFPALLERDGEGSSSPDLRRMLDGALW
jgi:hypothetical protein